MGICRSCCPWKFVCHGRLQDVVPHSAWLIFYCHHVSLATHSLSPWGSAPKGGALSCPMSLLHFPIHSYSFPFIPSIQFHFLLLTSLLRTFSDLGLLCPCLRTPLHATASMHLTCLSSRLFQTHPCVIVSLFWQFTLATYLMRSSVRYHM